MSFKYHSLKLKSSVVVAKYLFAMFVVSLLIFEGSLIYHKGISAFSIVKVCLILFFLKLFYQTLKFFYYTFYSFSIFIFLYLSFSLVYIILSSFEPMFIIPLLFSFVFLLTLLQVLSSPFFLPRVTWWEYDFRYRGDAKTEVFIGPQVLSGRLVDLRRHQLSLHLFQEISLGEMIKIRPLDFESKAAFAGEIVSQRTYSLGRGFTYGIRLRFSDKKTRRDFKKFAKDWRKIKKVKKRLKFGNS